MSLQTTPLALIKLAMKNAGVLGVGQSPLAEDTNDAFNTLNFMLAQWQRKRWLVWHEVDVAKVSTGAQSYTVGSGGDFNVPRPDRLEAAFFRQVVPSQPNVIDYPLELIEARETYNDIALKGLISFPSYAFYDAAFPVGVLYPWPVPQANIYEIHISLKEQLGAFTSLVQNVNLPPEYYAAILYNLTIRLSIAYQLPIDPGAASLAKEALEVIRGANAQVPRLRLPVDAVRPRLYNIYSDSTY